MSYRHKPMFMIIQTVWNYFLLKCGSCQTGSPLQSGSCWLLGDHKEIAHGVRRVARPSNGPSSNTRIIHNSQQEHSWCSPSGKLSKVALYRPVLQAALAKLCYLVKVLLGNHWH